MNIELVREEMDRKAEAGRVVSLRDSAKGHRSSARFARVQGKNELAAAHEALADRLEELSKG